MIHANKVKAFANHHVVDMPSYEDVVMTLISSLLDLSPFQEKTLFWTILQQDYLGSK